MFNTVHNCRNNALDIMETNSGLWNTEAEEATEDGNGLPGFSFGKDPFVSSNSDMTSSHYERS